MFLIKCDSCENLRSKFINYSSNFPSVFSVILIPKSVFLHYVADTYIIAYSTVYSDTNKAVIAMILNKFYSKKKVRISLAATMVYSLFLMILRNLNTKRNKEKKWMI